MELAGLQLPIEKIREVCDRFRVARLSVFGSALRDSATARDVDLLVEFQSGVVLSMLEFARLERELEGVIGRRVDLREPGDLSHLFREQVKLEARLVVAA
jgi:predicted nucleotidyltransferase